MLATMGGQPQLVTFALDELLLRGEPIREVIVIYLSAEGSQVNRAMNKLLEEFPDDYYTYSGHACRLRPLPIRDGNNRLTDIRDEADATATWEMLRDLIITLKNERQHLHLCVSGGRRMMALLMTSLAMLHFTPRDKLWHIYTPKDFLARAREGHIMHAKPDDGVQLLQVPLVPMGSQFPILRELAQASLDHSTILANQIRNSERKRCRRVEKQLTPRQLDTLKAFAAGLSPQQVGDELNITLNTVNSHRKTIVELCRNEWPDQDNIRYHHLREWFGPYFHP